MARVRKEKAGSAPGGLVWDKDGAVVDVPDDLAAELIRIPTGGFSTVPEDTPVPEPAVTREPLTPVPGPHVFRAGRTSTDGPIGIPTGLPAHTQPVPAGNANPGGEPPTPDWPHGAVKNSTDDEEPGEDTDEDSDDAPSDDVKPPAKVTRARQRRRVTE